MTGIDLEAARGAHGDARLCPRWTASLAGLLTLATLAACSGGGGNGPTPEEPPIDPPHYPPMNVVATPGDTEVTLEFSWGAVSRFDVYWSTTSGLPLAQRNLVSGATSPFRHEGLVNGTTYHYVVSWVDLQGGEHPQAEVSATPRVPYDVPVLRSATAGADLVELMWEADAGYASFNLYWSRSPGVTPETAEKIGGLFPHEPSHPAQWWHTHAGRGGGTYHYVVTGVTAKGSESAASNELSATVSYGTTITASAPDGAARWMRGLDGLVAAEAVATFADGSSCVAGRFACSVVLGAGEPTETTLTSPSCPWPPADLFVAKYDPDGRLLWARAAPAGSVERGVAIAALPDGSVAVTGSFLSWIAFRDGEREVLIPTKSPLLANVFVARYGPDGRVAWAAGGGADNGPWGGGHEGRGVAALSDGSVVVTGSFFRRIELDGGATLETTPGCYTNDFDLFLVRYRPDGTIAWARRAGGCSWEEGLAISAAADDSVVVTGRFHGLAAVFGPGDVNETTLSADDFDAFLARYGPDGSLAWVKAVSGDDNDVGLGVTALPDGGAALVGWFAGSATFGPGEPDEATLAPAHAALARYRADGTVAWARAVGGDALLRGVAPAGEGGALLVAGSFEQSAIFGAGTAGEATLATVHPETFGARYDGAGGVTWAKPLERGSTYATAIAALPGGGSVAVATKQAVPID